ncbi:MAG TPA: hypothetical protein VLB46_04590 [Pyrinomonadaceae bacterium]|nr:hypothetical protein [Pyrinomonadaceae bacterium]
MLGWYVELQSALQREIDDLKKIQALTAPSDSQTRESIAKELDKLTSESAEANNTIASLRNITSTVNGAEVSSVATAGNPSVVNPVVTKPEISSALPTSSNLPATGSNTPASQASTSLNLDLNNSIREAVRAKIQQREGTKQAETPSAATNSTSLVDTSSAGDIVNVGFALAGLTTDNNGANAAGSVSVTTSAYAFYALAKNVDPLNPSFYNRHSDWRRLSFTLGYDDEKLKDGTTEKAPIFGFKYLFVDKRDPARKRNEAQFNTITDNLKRASVAFGNLTEVIAYSLIRNSAVKKNFIIPQFRTFLAGRLKTLPPTATVEIEHIKGIQKRLDEGKEDLFVLNADGFPPNRGTVGAWEPEALEFYTDIFRNAYFGPDYRTKIKNELGQQVLDDLDAFIAKQLTDTKAFEDLSDTTQDALEKIRRAPQFSFSFLTKQRSESSDEYHAETIFDYGVADRINLTLNGSFLYNDSKVIGGDTRGGKFAGQFRFQLTPERLAGRNPFFFFISGNAETMSGRKPLYQAQAKLNIPILNGMDFPIALTYSNRNELDNKHKTRVQFGFAIDTARILQALTSK